MPLPVTVTEDPAIRALVESAVPELLAAELWARAEATTVSEEPKQAEADPQALVATGDASSEPATGG